MSDGDERRNSMTENEERSRIGVYPVGALHDWKNGKSLIHIAKQAMNSRKRSWRSFRNYFNGYLAEWHFPPLEMRHSRCGRGWSKRRALRRLGVHIAESNWRRGDV